MMQKIASGKTTLTITERTGKSITHDLAKIRPSIVRKEVSLAMRRRAELRWMYLPDCNFEVIKTAIPPKYQQPWHRHERVKEATLALKGQILLLERVGNRRPDRLILRPGDFVSFSKNNAYHTMANREDTYALSLTFKFIASGKKDEELFRKDWFPLSETDERKVPPEHKK
jgi:quercetin dioxygenase-like cupin family protein